MTAWVVSTLLMPMKKAQLYSRAVMLIVNRPRCLSALSGANTEVRRAGLGCSGTNSTVATSAIAMSTETPKNGPPAHVAEHAAEQRAERDADAEGCFVEDDRAGEAARRGGHDHGQRGGDEERIAQAPPHTALGCRNMLDVPALVSEP